MQMSPLQPQGHVFQSVSVLVEFDENGNPIQAANFEFSGVKITCDVGHADIEPNPDSPTNDCMLVSIRLKIPNADGKKCPYKIDVQVTGVFRWLAKNTEPEKRRDLTVVNGASLLYGTIREMVLNISSRSVCGPLLIPAMNFEDNKPSIQNDRQQDIANANVERPDPL